MLPKVFGIGFPKTGTSSLGKALGFLGYRVQTGIFVNKENHPQLKPPITQERLTALALPYVEQHDAFEDFPWVVLYREMDRHFPGSKFVLTTRDPETWIRSARNHAPVITGTPWRYLAGENGPEASHEAFLRAYHAHNRAVREYFMDRPGALLVLPLENAGWKPLCTFLGCRKPMLRKYPHKNKFRGA